MDFKYIIVGGGLAGASAIEGIRQEDSSNPILLISNEASLPYHRPPLTKSLWSHKKTISDIYYKDIDFYSKNKVELLLNEEVIHLDTEKHSVSVKSGRSFSFEKCLLATGGTPKQFSFPGHELGSIIYYRYLSDYEFLSKSLRENSKILIIGGGFIGSELSASLKQNNYDVTMIFPESAICSRIFPHEVSVYITKMYEQRGVSIVKESTISSIKKQGDFYSVLTSNSDSILVNFIVAGLGIRPNTKLAIGAGLQVNNGIAVNEYLETSQSGIYAAGDVAFFPYTALNERKRVEHWDNAISQGNVAGRNMAGAQVAYTYMPYFFSDLFEFGYEAVGETRSDYEVVQVWGKEFEKGVLYYVNQGKVLGILTCNIYGQMDLARKIIQSGEKLNKLEIRNKIPF